MFGEKIHFKRPPSFFVLKSFLDKGFKVFHMPQSCFNRLSKKSKSLLATTDCKIIIETARGRPLNISFEKLLQVIELHKDNRTFRQIEEITGIPKSTAHYLIKYAERQKIKGKGKIIYL